MKNIKKIDIKSYEETSSLIYAIFFLVIGVILYTNTGQIANYISIIVGTILITIGAIKLISYNRFKKKFEIINTSDLISGIIFISLGLFAMIFSNAIIITLRIIMGSFIVYSGVLRLISFLKLRKYSKGIFKWTLLISILMIVCGLYILLNPNLIIKTIALFIIIYSVIEIIGFICYSQVEKPNNNDKVIIEGEQ